MSEFREGENMFSDIELLKKHEEDERLCDQSRRDELLGICEERMGGCTTRDQLDQVDFVARALLPVKIVEL